MRLTNAIIAGMDIIIEIPNNTLGAVTGICNFADKMMDALKYIDGQTPTVELRSQFASTAMQSLLTAGVSRTDKKYLVSESISFADELIKQLNENINQR